MNIEVKSDIAMRELGAAIGALLRGGEVIELIGDVGAGKTTLTKGLALGLRIDEAIQSPSFTISREYPARDDLRLVHYDFYRLSDPGLMANDLLESMQEKGAIVVVEWSDIVKGLLPENRLRVEFTQLDEATRQLHIQAPQYILEHI